MSLMNLLTLGHSFEGAKDRPGTYKLRTGAALPKFAPVKRPIGLTPAPILEKAAAQTSLFDSKNVATHLRQAEKTLAVNQQTQMNTTTQKSDSPTSSQTSAKPALPVSKLHVWTHWTQALKELLFSQHSRRKITRPAIQAELVLEKVAVMRNDLSDADLEVVEQKTKQKLATRDSDLAGETWTRRSVRFFNPKKGWVFQKEVGMQQKEIAPVELEKTPELVERI